MRGAKAAVKSSVSFTINVAANGYIVSAGADISRDIAATRYVARDADDLAGLIAELLSELAEPSE